MENTPLFWAGFVVFVLAMRLLDLLVPNRKAHVVRMRGLWAGVPSG